MIDFDDEPDQEKRIEKLRGELEKLGGSTSHDSDLPADLEEQFLKHILEFETAEPSTLLQWLENSGLEVPSPDQLNDEQLRAKLWEVINRMASLGAYLHNTNHLSERALYSYLFDEGLREDTLLFPENPSFVYGLDLLGSGSDEDMQLYMKYFADDEYRKQWATDSPDFEMPPHEDPPFDRDKDLPKPPFG
ncbi:MAG TPA: hypothetical protein VHE60_16185 [Pyrinomonadaceae bacterium]|nr:hypothetical protein [Pyrinomonadaceae bacterium]